MKLVHLLRSALFRSVNQEALRQRFVPAVNVISYKKIDNSLLSGSKYTHVIDLQINDSLHMFYNLYSNVQQK